MALPQHCPTSGVLDDLDLIALGAVAPRQFDVEGSPFSLSLPEGVREQALAAGGLEIVDPEGLVLAVATPSGGGWDIDLRGTPAYGPFRRLRRRAEDVRLSGRPVVPVEAPLTAAQVEALKLAPAATVLVLAGHGWASVPSVDLVRGTLAATRKLDVDVVVAPLARRGDTTQDTALRTEAVGAYGETIRELPADDGPLAPGAEPPARERGIVVLFTGLSGSGKSTLARALVDQLLETTERTVTSLDGDVVRRHLSAGLSFSPTDRETNIRRIGWVAAEIARHGGVAICSPIAPYDATRQEVRRMAAEAGARFVLIHVATPVEECERRDRKGLYAKARAGEIGDFTGISAPYEAPVDADVVVDTTGMSIDEALAPVLRAVVEPPAVVEQVANPLKVLVVCTANICRSPYLELTLRAAVGDAIEVSGAGTHGFADHPMDEVMAAEARTRGLDPTEFRSRPVTKELVAGADLVLTAAASHRSFLLQEFPGAFRKVFTLGQFARGIEQLEASTPAREAVAWIGTHRPSADGTDIEDPYRRGPEAAAVCADHIDRLLSVVAPALARR